MENNNKKLGIALVGLGRYSEDQLAPALLETRNCYLAGIVTGTPQKAQIWADRYKLSSGNIYNYSNFDSISSNKDIDIVYVVLPNSMHKEFVLRAARAGKHIICEKPLSLTSEDCEEMIRECQENNVQLSVGYRLHFEPYNLEAMTMAQSEKFGRVKHIKAGFGFNIFSNGNRDQWRLNKAMAGGGALMDVGIYTIQASRYITGKDPVSVEVTESVFNPDYYNDVEEKIYWRMEFPGGVTAECFACYTEPIDYLYVECEKGWFEISPAFAYNGQKGISSLGKIQFQPINQQAAQMDHFASCIMEHINTPLPGEEGLRDIIIMNAIYTSMEEKRKIELSETIANSLTTGNILA